MPQDFHTMSFSRATDRKVLTLDCQELQPAKTPRDETTVVLQTGREGRKREEEEIVLVVSLCLVDLTIYPKHQNKCEKLVLLYKTTSSNNCPKTVVLWTKRYGDKK